MEKTKKKITKKREIQIPLINFDELYEKVNKLLEKNKTKFYMVAFSDVNNYFVIIHKKKLTVKRVNENSVFQPVTFEEDKEFPIPFIIWVSYTKNEPEFIQEMKKFNTIIIKCLPMDDFGDKIKKYVLKD